MCQQCEQYCNTAVVQITGVYFFNLNTKITIEILRNRRLRIDELIKIFSSITQVLVCGKNIVFWE